MGAGQEGGIEEEGAGGGQGAARADTTARSWTALCSKEVDKVCYHPRTFALAVPFSWDTFLLDWCLVGRNSSFRSLLQCVGEEKSSLFLLVLLAGQMIKTMPNILMGENNKI